MSAGKGELGPDYERQPCARCGAVTVSEAATKCRPLQTEAGEQECPDEDAEGFLLGPSAAFYRKQDAWVDSEVAKMLAAQPTAEGGE